MFNFRSVFSLDASTASSKKQIYLGNKLEDFSEDEGGIGTVWALFWLILCFSIGGLAIDTTNAWKVHTILQSTADSAALAGVYELQALDENKLSQSNGDIKANVVFEANKYATLNMHLARYGDVLDDADIHLGYWDSDNRSFEIIENGNSAGGGNYYKGPADAVRVITRQSGVNGTSAVGTFFLRFVGFDRFTVLTVATAKMFTARCDFDGIIALGEVHLSTQERFLDEYCVHGELGIDMSQQNFFQEGTIASMPDLDDCGPGAGSCTDDANPGIESALQQGTVTYSKATHIDEYLDTLFNYHQAIDNYGETKVVKYIDELLVAGGYNGSGLYNEIPVGKVKGVEEVFDFSEIVPGVINVIECIGNGNNIPTVNLAGETNADNPVINMKDVIIVGRGCNFSFDSSTTFRDAIIATDSTGNMSLSAPTGGSGIVLGEYQEDCIEGGEVTLITKGDAHFSAKLSAYDLEVIAEGDVHLSAKANSMGEHIGTNISTLGDVFVTTGHTFSGCEGETISVFDPVMSWALVQ